MRLVTVELVRRASKRYLFNKKNNLPNTVPTRDIWGNALPTPPAFPFRFFRSEESKG